MRVRGREGSRPSTSSIRRLEGRGRSRPLGRRWLLGLRATALLGPYLISPGLVRASAAEPLTVGPTAWSSPVVTSDGAVLALARDRAGVRLDVMTPGAEGTTSTRLEPRAGRALLAVARGSNAAAPIVVRASEPGAVPEEPESLVRLGEHADDDVVLFRAGAGERLADPVIAPGRQWIAVVARLEPRARGERVVSRVLMVSALDGSARTIEDGEGDRGGLAFLGESALGFVRREGEYSLFVQVPLGADGDPAGPRTIEARDRAAWSAVAPLDERGTRLLVARDAGRGPALAIVEDGGAGVRPLTEEGRAAIAPALTPDGREVVFVGAGEGGMNLFRVALGAGPAALVGPPAAAADDEREPRKFESLRAKLANAPCLACHDHERGLDVVGASAHATLACTDCHVDVTGTPHAGLAVSERVVGGPDGRGAPVTADGSPLPAPGAGLRGVGRPVARASAATLACGSCHRAEAERWASDVHGKAFEARSAAAPGCPSCHGDHDVWKLADPRSRVARSAVAGGCGVACHEGAWDVTRVDGGAETMHQTRYRSDPLTTYRESIHAKKLRLGERHAATCASCHTAHGVRPARDPASSLNVAHAAKTCASNGKCHVGAPDEYVTLVDHVVAVPRGHTARGVADAAFGVIGAVTVAFAGGDLLLDALRRAMARLRSRKERRR